MFRKYHSNHLIILTFLIFTALSSVAAAAGERTEISAECSFSAGAECNVACDNIEFWAKCEAHLEFTDCDFRCEEFEISVDCTAECNASCTGECTLDPGQFDCNAHCQGGCAADCAASCEASANAGECKGRCSAYCEGECSSECNIQMPELDCNAACDASCKGDCSAEANIDCHFCKVEYYAGCEAEFNAGCHGGCDAHGVLECNGEFIDIKENIDAAVAWVKANMPEAVITYDGSASCSSGDGSAGCEAEGSCSYECAVGSSAPGGSNQAAGFLFFIAAIGLFCFYRRK